MAELVLVDANSGDSPHPYLAFDPESGALQIADDYETVNAQPAILSAASRMPLPWQSSSSVTYSTARQQHPPAQAGMMSSIGLPTSPS